MAYANCVTHRVLPVSICASSQPAEAAVDFLWQKAVEITRSDLTYPRVMREVETIYDSNGKVENVSTANDRLVATGKGLKVTLLNATCQEKDVTKNKRRENAQEGHNGQMAFVDDLFHPAAQVNV